MIYKTGQMVILLPRALNVHVPKDEIGKIGIVYNPEESCSSFQVRMIAPRTKYSFLNHKFSWSVSDDMVKLYISKGKQLVFDFK